MDKTALNSSVLSVSLCALWFLRIVFWDPAQIAAAPPTTADSSAVQAPASDPPGYRGISGPGEPVVGDGSGGWRSGPDGLKSVAGDGDHPSDGSAVKAGLLPPIRPLINLHLRDTVICLGGDGNYYMTGSSGDNIWYRNDGVELWKSPDLKTWSYLGLVWSIEKDGGWEKNWRLLHNKPSRAVWAPELHYIKNNYFICLCMAPGGIAILKSSTGKPEGPYVNALSEDKPMGGGIDPTLFEDDDGKVYFTYLNGNHIARMKDDMSGLAEAYHNIKVLEPTLPLPTTLPTMKGNDLSHPLHIGREGVSLFKESGRYYLGAADWPDGRYSSMVAISDNIYGPYRELREAVPCGGGTNYFKDKSGHWWCAFFGNDKSAPWREKPGIVPISFDSNGLIQLVWKGQS
jgi:xylan 1,4-beta-xylosidase